MNFQQPGFPGNSTMFPLSDWMGSPYMQNANIVSVLNGQTLPPGIEPLIPYVNVQPSANCPRKFVFVDLTLNGRQVMFNPQINHYPGFGVNHAISYEKMDQKDGATDDGNVISSFEEDSDDIDALLSTEYEENQECNDEDDDVVSTARNDARYYKCDSPDSCSNYRTTPSAKKPFLRKPTVDRCNDKKHRRIRKMVKALKGIVPGANHMNAVNVLDEAVRYLKSLRVEVQKLGAVNARI